MRLHPMIAVWMRPRIYTERQDLYMKKKRFATVIMVLAVIVGLGLILYPTVSDYVNSLGYRQTIAEYNRSVQELDTETYEQLLNAAYEYNARLSGRTMSPLSLSDEERADRCRGPCRCA